MLETHHVLTRPDRDNATAVMNTASGVVPSGPSPIITVTVDGVGDVGVPEASTEADVSAADFTVTVTSISTTITNTRTVIASEVLSAASVSTEESNPGDFVSDSTGECAPTTFTLTVTETASPATAVQVSTTANNKAPFTTLIISDLYSKGAKPTQPVTASDTNIADKKIPATTAQSGGEFTTAGGNDRTVTVTVFEQPTVFITSTMIANSEMPSPTTPTDTADIPSHPCASENITDAASPRSTVTLSKVVTETYTTTVDGSASLMTGIKTVFTTEVVGVEETDFATGTVGALSNTVASLMTITVQPAPETTQPAPEAIQAAPDSGTSPTAIPKGSAPTQGKRTAGAIITGCVVVLVTTVLCML